MAQAADIVHKLGFDVLFKVLGEVIHGAGEHEVLPHQQTQLVADIIEEVIGVVAAAPYTDAVHVGGFGVLQQPPGALRIHPGQQVVLGDVVGAHGEDIHAVDAVAEALTPLILLPGDGEGAQADAAAPAVKPIAQLHGDGIQGLIAQTVGPPEGGILDFNDGLLAFGGENGAVGSDDADLHISGAGELGDVGIYLQRNLAFLMELQDMDVPDSGGLYAQNADVSPDAGVGQTGAPVPAEHAVGFADQGEAHHGVGGAVGAAEGVGFFYEAGWGVEFHGNFVFSGPQNGFHIEFIGAVHVLGGAHQASVDRNGGQGVQTVAVQHHGVIFQQRGGDGEASAVDKVVIHQLQCFVFVVAVEGIGNLTGGEQIVVNRAGDLSRDAGEGASGDIQHPCPAKRQFLHRLKPPNTIAKFRPIAI